jgi:hypothetical protein
VRAHGLATSVTYLSGRMETLLGHGLKEIDGPDGFARLLHPDDRDRALAKHDETPAVDRRPAVEYRLSSRSPPPASAPRWWRACWTP